MNIVSIFHMARGQGETSYAQNSHLQKEVIESVMDMTLSSAMEACALEAPPATVSIADLGCASGRNTLFVVENIVRAVRERRREQAKRQLPEFMVFLNDLPSNDFNALFSLVPEFVQKLMKTEHDDGGILVSVAGVPGSFYGRLFPSRSLHLITTFTSLHWLSKVPDGLLNKGESNKRNVYMSPASPSSVATRYFEQFREDFSVFLKSRSQELVAGGRMVVSLLGRRSHDKHKKINEIAIYEALGKSLSMLVSQKLVGEEKVDSFNLPLYTPSKQELEDQVYREGSFSIVSMKQDYHDWMVEHAPKMLSMLTRTVTESLICHHFGEEIIEPLFETHTQLLCEKSLAREDIGWCHITLALCKSAT